MRRTALEYLLAAVGSVAIFALLYHTLQTDLRVPSSTMGGDVALYAATLFKGAVDNPWYSFNRYLGAPTGLDLRDYPMPDLLFHLWVKAATLFTRNSFLIANLTLILSFPLVTLPSLFVLRRLGVRYVVALTASLLFAFISYHHMRGLVHVLYAVGYFSVPFATLLALEAYRGRSLLLDPGPTWWRPRVARTRESLAAVALALVIGLTGAVYYPFFSAFTILVGGVGGAIRTRGAMPLLRAAAIVAIVASSMLANLAPSILWVHEHGRAPCLDPFGATEREAKDSELYGLKITQLLFPLTGHRFEPFRDFKARYSVTAPLTNENQTAYLGLVGGAGFLYLVVSSLGRARASRDEPEGGDGASDGIGDPGVMDGLRAFNVAAFVLGTIGGFSAVFAYLASTQVRAYNRISVYIAFFSLAALALLAERAARSFRRRRLLAWVLPAGLTPLLALGLLDQTPPVAEPDEGATRAFVRDDAFIKSIEASLPPESSVFQLPYIPFPEYPPVHGLGGYDLLRPYLHSTTIHWSFGGIRGRRGDQWNKEIANRAPRDMVDALAEAGFAGIHVSRDGYEDSASALEAALTAVLGPPAFVHPDGRSAFFPLGSHATDLRRQLGDAEFERLAEEVRTPIFFGWFDGFYPTETQDGKDWAWSRAKGVFMLDNPSTSTRSVVFDTAFRTANGPAGISIEGEPLRADLRGRPEDTRVRQTISIPPGEHLFRLTTDGRRTAQGGEWRDLRVAMRRPTLRPANAALWCELDAGFILPAEPPQPLWGAGPRSKVAVYAERAGAIRLRLAVRSAVSPEQAIVIRVNGDEVGNVRPTAGGDLPIGFNAIAGDNVVTLEYARWNHHPDEFAPGDRRPFAVAFSRASCEADGGERVMFP